MTVVPDFATNDELVDAVRLVKEERLQARTRDLPYRLAVLGTTTADLVEHAGGMLFDHVMAGWSVTVLLPPDADPKPLQILGTRMLDLRIALTMDLKPALASRRRYPWPHKVMIAGDLCHRNDQLREALVRSFETGDPHTMLWGRNHPAFDEDDTATVEHQLSNAARAFKRQALSATSVTTGVMPIESFVANKVHAKATPALHLA